MRNSILNQVSRMEAETISKNGASLKSRMSRNNFFGKSKLVIGTMTVASMLTLSTCSKDDIVKDDPQIVAMRNKIRELATKYPHVFRDDFCDEVPEKTGNGDEYSGIYSPISDFCIDEAADHYIDYTGKTKVKHREGCTSEYMDGKACLDELEAYYQFMLKRVPKTKL